MVPKTILRKLLTINSTATSVTSRVPTTTKPVTADGTSAVIDLTDRDGGVGNSAQVPSYLKFIPFGTAAQDKDYVMRIWGWTRSNNATPIWFPELLAGLTVTLGNLAGTAIAANTFMAEAITAISGETPAAPFIDIISPGAGNDRSACFRLHTFGCELVEVTFDIDAGSAASTSANTYWGSLG